MAPRILSAHEAQRPMTSEVTTYAVRVIDRYAAMIRYARSIMMLAMLYLLTAPVVVYAECTWVLWWEESTSVDTYRTSEARIPGGKMDHQEKHTFHPI